MKFAVTDVGNQNQMSPVFPSKCFCFYHWEREEKKEKERKGGFERTV